jgi:hypothetical protein
MIIAALQEIPRHFPPLPTPFATISKLALTAVNSGGIQNPDFTVIIQWLHPEAKCRVI